MTAPLDGIRVLDFTRVLAGPHATRMLCDLGADVIKIEPPAGDLTRFTTPKVNGLSTYFVQQNAGKRNVSIDLGMPAGAALAADLAARCDVVVENYRPGVMARLGLDHVTLRSRHPRLVYASITGYGSSGPWTDRRAYAPVVGAEAGITKAQGDARGSAYTNDPFSHADVYTALEAASAILAALYRREHTGTGCWIDVSMAQTMLYVNEHLHDQLYDGAVDPSWIRSFAPGDYLVVETANGDLVTISGHPAERGTFELFVAAFGLDELRRRSDSAPSRRAWRTSASCASASLQRRPASPTPRRWSSGWRCTASPPARCATPASSPSRHGRRTAGRSPPSPTAATGRSASPTRRGASTTCRDRSPARRAYRGEDNRAVLADLLGYDDAAHRRAGGVRRAVEPPVRQAAERVPPQQGGTLEPGTLESGTLAIGTLLPGVLLPGTLLPPAHPASIGGCRTWSMMWTVASAVAIPAQVTRASPPLSTSTSPSSVTATGPLSESTDPAAASSSGDSAWPATTWALRIESSRSVSARIESRTFVGMWLKASLDGAKIVNGPAPASWSCSDEAATAAENVDSSSISATASATGRPATAAGSTPAQSLAGADAIPGGTVVADVCAAANVSDSAATRSSLRRFDAWGVSRSWRATVVQSWRFVVRCAAPDAG